MRIGGIASGMDTEQMVKDLMRAERARMNKFLRQEQTIKWKQTAYNDTNKIMANFILNSRSDFGLNQISSTGNIRKSNVDNFSWAKKATSSNEGIVSATARANAVNGDHKIKVSQLASNATMLSNNLKIANDENKLEIPVLNDNFKFNEAGEIRIETHMGSTVIEINAGDDISTFVSKINNAIDSADPDKKLSLGVRAAFDRNLGQLMITTKDTGKDIYVSVSDVTGDNAEKIFGLYDAGVTSATSYGKSAEIEYNGNPLEMATNNFSVFGIDINLKDVTPANTTININIGTNVDGIYDKVKGFIDNYNEMVGFVTSRTSETRYRDFFPLVKDEKDAMSEKDIEQWEQKAKSGILRNDETITKTFQGIRSSLYMNVGGVTGTFKHLTDIGIATGGYKEGGKLVINENRLRDAINNDPEGVMDLFFKAPDIGLTGEARTKESGIVQRVYDGIVSGMKEVIRKAGTGGDTSFLRSVQGNILTEYATKHSSISVLDKDISGINSRISKEETILAKREERYWKQFSAMEKAMAKMQQQSTWIMSQMGLSQ